MVIAAFIIASLVVIIALGAVQWTQKAQDELARVALERAVDTFLTDVNVPDRHYAEGRYDDLTVRIDAGHHEISFEVQLVPALVPYATLVSRFAQPQLVSQLAELHLKVTAADTMRGSVPREPGLSETLVTIEKRLDVVHAIAALRKHAPAILLGQLKRAHDSREVDEMLLALAHAFPTAPETEDAIAHAAHLEHTDPARIRDRAAQWLSAGRRPAFPVR